MSDFAQWDVISVPQEETGITDGAGRQALVISNGALHEHLNLLWIVTISQAAKPASPYDIRISKLEEAGLKSPSIVHTAHIARLKSSGQIRRLGHLHEWDADTVELKLFECLGWTTAVRE